MFETKAIWFVKIISLKFGGLREWLNEQIANLSHELTLVL